MQLPTSGMVLVHKPIGPTSHDMVSRVRKLTGVKRVGHAGTLDPFAEGLLIILIGREWTKKQAEFLNLSKTYETTIYLGARSTTDDVTGEITVSQNSTHPSQNEIMKILSSFLGVQKQLPPPYSAKKINGVPAYKLAREGKEVELKPKEITLYSLEFLSYAYPRLSFRTTVSSGTYIRSLARDIGDQLGCGAYCETLTRTSIGTYSLSDALFLETSSRPTNT